MLDDLLARFARGDRLALSRLLSLLGRGERADEILPRLPPPATQLRVVAVTGGAGVGKSTLTGRLIESLRAAGQKVAVLACDPQSPVSGGALLGDRFRMPNRPDEGVFIRSLSAPAGRGALAAHLDDMARLLGAFGFDVVLIETVGAGQGDTAAHDLADVVVLLLQPETGDDLQWEKAGVLEVADVVVVHKADLPGAANVEAQVRSMLALGDREAPPILRVSARSGEGVDPLRDLILSHPLRPRRADGRALLKLTQEALAARFARAEAAHDADLEGLIERWQRGELPPADVAASLWRLLERYS